MGEVPIFKLLEKPRYNTCTSWNNGKVHAMGIEVSIRKVLNPFDGRNYGRNH